MGITWEAYTSALCHGAAETICHRGTEFTEKDIAAAGAADLGPAA